jgi:hypothetical protein
MYRSCYVAIFSFIENIIKSIKIGKLASITLIRYVNHHAAGRSTMQFADFGTTLLLFFLEWT